jgi:hypothetical protein
VFDSGNAIQKNEDHFHFVVGDDHYECPFYVAAFLSPKICQLRSHDASLNELELRTNINYLPGLCRLVVGAILRLIVVTLASWSPFVKSWGMLNFFRLCWNNQAEHWGSLRVFHVLVACAE